jgi:Ca2+-binding EF-hand superfamily protein
MDANADGKISQEEWRGSAEVFARLDTDNDGFLTRPELAQPPQVRAPGGNRRNPATNPRGMDADRDGRISFGEWMGAPEMFDRLDVNDDGFLSPEEIRQGRPNPPDRPQGPVNLLRQMDTDGDGKVSSTEWTGPTELFERLDADKSGFIEDNEVPAPRRGRTP